MLTPALDACLPGWLARLDAPPSSRDPLGLQAQAGMHADALLPGLNVFTSRARYYSFLCRAVQKASEGAPPATHLARLHRFERLLVLCETLRHSEATADDCAYIGRRRGRRYIAEYRDPQGWRLPTLVLKNQTSNGAFRLYRTSLIDLGLAEECDDDGLGLSLAPRGVALGERYGRRIDDGVARWALEESDGRKRTATLLDVAEVLCLSVRPDGHERNHLRTALFGTESDHALRRRETVRLLFQQGLLATRSMGDVASEDADAVAEDGGTAVALAESLGNWAVIRAVLGCSSTEDLRLLQVAGAYEVLALALNQLVAALLAPLIERGRLGLRAWLRLVGERAGVGFTQGTAAAWAGRRPVVVIVDELLRAGRPWPDVAALAIELLITVALDERLRGWLTDVHGEPLVDRVAALAVDAASTSVAELIAGLIPDLVTHHQHVSARKAKAEWVAQDGPDLVRGDPRPMAPRLHTLRLAQVQQLARDLALTPGEVTDEA